VLSLAHFLDPLFLLLYEVLILNEPLLSHSLLLLDLKLKQKKLALFV
jgi:hypothetical protein